MDKPVSVWVYLVDDLIPREWLGPVEVPAWEPIECTVRISRAASLVSHALSP